MVFMNEQIEKPYAVALQTLSKSNDTEAAHILADTILCELLTKLGCTNVVAEFQSLKKWY
jgi:hypothetical protein